MELSSYFFAILAGALTVASPCIFPILPLVFSSSFRAGRWGPLWFSFGLLLTFVCLTFVIARAGHFFGIDQTLMKNLSSVALILVGIVMISVTLQEKLTLFLQSLLSKTKLAASQELSSKGSKASEFFLGTLTAAIWSPCSGPSLGLASVMGWDKALEAQLVGLSPDWLLELTTKF